jgi:hypothetical protein
VGLDKESEVQWVEEEGEEEEEGERFKAPEMGRLHAEGRVVQRQRRSKKSSNSLNANRGMAARISLSLTSASG